MYNSTAITDLPQLPGLIRQLWTPTTRIEAAWAVAADLKHTGLEQIRQGRRQEAIELSPALGERMTEHMRASGLLGVFLS